MASYRLYLTPENNQSPIEISLSMGLRDFASLDRIDSSAAGIFSDQVYYIRLDGIPENAHVDILFFVNDEEVPITYQNGDLIISNTYRNKIFEDCYGFVEISLVIKDLESNDEFNLHSNYLPVLVKRGRINDSINRMLNYVNDHQKELLLSDKLTAKSKADMFQGGVKNLETQIVLADEILKVYKSLYSYFKTNARYTTESRDTVDRIEKLQYATSKTAQYVAMHPELLKRVPVSSGVKVGRQTFIPKRVLTSQIVITKNIYENQVVVGFLHVMINNLAELADQVESLIEHVPQKENAGGDYVYSAYILFSQAKHQLVEGRRRINEYLLQFKSIYILYKDIFDCDEIKLNAIPKRTAIFASVQQYQRIFAVIFQWFKFGLYDFSSERFVFSFLKISSLYECYTLMKFINFYKENGFGFVKGRNCNYPDAFWAHDVNCNNTFVYSKEKKEVTLYYQPVIYDFDSSKLNSIALYRNMSLSLEKNMHSIQTGHYYIPDILIKIKNETDEKYVIVDSKFSDYKSVQRNYIIPLAFKYITSISTNKDNAKLIGLVISYGKVGENLQLQSVYDREIKEKSISPFFYTLPLNEERELATLNAELKTILSFDE